VASKNYGVKRGMVELVAVANRRDDDHLWDWIHSWGLLVRN